MANSECRILTAAELDQYRLSSTMGTNVFGFGAFDYRVRFGTRVEERKCHEMHSVFAPSTLADVVVIVVKLDYFDAITSGRNPTSCLNPFELMVHRALIEHGKVDTSNHAAYRIYPTMAIDKHIVGLVVPLSVLKALPGRMLKLRHFGVEVALAGVKFPSPDNVEASLAIKSILNTEIHKDGTPPKGLFGEWFMVTESASNIWWIYDKVKGAMPITSIAIEGTQPEIIRYTVYHDRQTNTPVLEVTSSTLLELNDMDIDARSERFSELGVFRTENEAIASGEAHNKLLDHRLKIVGFDKVKAEMGRHERVQERAELKFKSEQHYKEKEEERKVFDAEEKRQQKGIRTTKMIMDTFKSTVDMVMKSVGLWVLIVKTFGIFAREGEKV